MYANLVAHRAALISVFISYSQTPAEAASPGTRGYIVCRVECLFSSQLAPVPYRLVNREAHVCEQLAHGRR